MSNGSGGCAACHGARSYASVHGERRDPVMIVGGLRALDVGTSRYTGKVSLPAGA